jgi:hypothetical protein
MRGGLGGQCPPPMRRGLAAYQADLAVERVMRALLEWG